MEQYISPELLTSGDFKQYQQQQQQQLQQTAASDFLSFTSPSDIIAPHPDQFELELDSSLAGFDPLQLQSFIIDDPFSFLRADTPTCGPPSTFTVSSESASAYESLSSYSESLSSYSESFYNYAPSNYSFPSELDMDFSRASISAGQKYVDTAAVQNTASGMSADALSEYSYSTKSNSPASSTGSSGQMLDERDVFNALPPSPVVQQGGSVYSDYGSDYYPSIASNHPSLGYTGIMSPSPVSAGQAAQIQIAQARPLSPVGLGSGLTLLPNSARNESRIAPRTSSSSRVSARAGGTRLEQNESAEDPKKRFPCPKCSKAFARGYNLKTHMNTHDPHRLKPFVCPQGSCERSFSRKHDLGRHLVSIHHMPVQRDGSVAGSSADGLSDNSERRIGVVGMKDELLRCEVCGACGPKKCAHTKVEEVK
ncbi:hypothetical protein EW145_g7275 [Phellinidium pouzarii]|uniref:C2H2-type domain-containing protein n=1 Tax=Phellinidium pouzarii TaxID=167371 RepID=A0A4S4KLN2_9AGAM|nr:hypothetical protein EW145_g7275 [Phellinidium pouzarii]